ncbi:MAG: DUF3617 domain-containing protein [Hyphomonadaceae bacterium]
MRTLAVIGLACGLAACSPPTQTSGDEAGGAAGGGGAMASSLQPGQYRTTVTMLEMTIPGVDSTSINMQPTTTEDCVTSTDVSEFTSGSMVDPDSGETCTQSNMNTGGGRIQGEANCTGENGTRTMRINGTYTSNHVEMEINSASDMPGGAGRMTQRMRIVTDRIGECAAGNDAE